MSMIGNYFMVGEDTVQKIQRGELSVDEAIYGEDDEVDEERALDIDKAWNAIHFVLAGEAGGGTGLLSLAVLGGDPIDGEDMGYGPALLIPKKQVGQLAQALQGWDEAAFRANFDLAAMRERGVYPVTESEDEEAFFGYVWAYFCDTRAFFCKAAAQGACLLFYIN